MRTGMRHKENLNFLSFILDAPLTGDDCLRSAFIRTEAGKEEIWEYAGARGGDNAARRAADRRPGPLSGPQTHHAANLAEFFAALGDRPTVIHDAGPLIQLIEASGAEPSARILDSRELARTAMPSLSDHSLTSVAAALSIESPKCPGAIEMARLTHMVWDALVAKVRSLPPPATAALGGLAVMAEMPLAEVFGKVADDSAEFSLSDEPEPELESIFKSHEKIFLQAQHFEEGEHRDQHLDTAKICAMFAETGAVGRNLHSFETREEQINMVQAVCEALNEGRHLMCEAGTGIGKSMAYLLPAIAWCRRNRDKIIVSTNTKNLQEQLADKDLPFLQKLLGDRFRTALLKGRRNYLCVRKFVNLIRYRNRELAGPEEAAALMPLLSWAAATKTGDISECAGFRFLALTPQVTATGDECMGRGCPFAGKCFVRRARCLAQLADIIVVNHALIFSDVTLDRPYLPRQRCIVFDEAHNIEDVATEAASVNADGLMFYRICRRLWRRRSDGSGIGMLSALMGFLSRSFSADEQCSKDILLKKTTHAVESVEELGNAVRTFFDMLSAPFDPLPPQEDRILLDRCRPEVRKTGPVGEGASLVFESCRKLRVALKSLVESLNAHEDKCDKVSEFAVDMTAQINRLRDAADALEFVLDRTGEDHVYWLERTGRGNRRFYALRAAPLDIGGFMRTFFFDAMRSVILTSATLRVDGRFDYIRERLGADHLPDDRLKCAAYGSPFDFRNQTLLCVPTFLPEAGGRRDRSFDEELSSFLIDLLRGTAGRSLVLFTSYSLLHTVYERIKRPLESADIPLLAQGKDGSRRVLTELFKDNINTVLLGTQSFWEGVDVLGESLSCLVVTKLPFHVFTDPLVGGRIARLREEGTDPFSHYTLPEAVISFRQGFGRLIRHRNDRGVVVVTDRRVVTRSYGRSFLSDLSTPHRVYKRKETLIEDVKCFLNEQTHKTQAR